MIVMSIISTKGGVGKTTVTANLGGFLADAGLKVLLLDLDIQPTLSSYYKLPDIAPCGIYELIAHNEQQLMKLISRTTIQGLDLIYSNDEQGQLNTLLLHSPDGRFRLKNLLPVFKGYDIVLIDTQGARSIMLEMAVVASTHILSPVTPEILAAREFSRGTLQLIQDLQPLKHLGVTLPSLQMLINRVPTISSSASLIQQHLFELFGHASAIHLLSTTIPAIEAYPKAATQSLPVHRFEYKKPTGRITPSSFNTMKALATELFPQWQSLFNALINGKQKEFIQ